MIWGSITMRSPIDLVFINGNLTGQRYIDEVLQPVVVPFLRQNNAILQDDNARPHRAARIQQYLQQRNIQHIDWPARLPDLSPIEHVWDILGQGVRNRDPQPKTTIIGSSSTWGIQQNSPVHDRQINNEHATSLWGMHTSKWRTHLLLTVTLDILWSMDRQCLCWNVVC